MDPEVVKAEEFQELVEALVVVAVAAFDFAIVAGSPGSDQLVDDPKLFAERVEGMFLPAVFPRCEGVLESVVRLDYFGDIAEESEGPDGKIDGVKRGGLVVPVQETFAVGLVDDGVLVELLVAGGEGGLAGSRDELGVHLPFLADRCWSIVLLRLV